MKIITEVKYDDEYEVLFVGDMPCHSPAAAMRELKKRIRDLKLRGRRIPVCWVEGKHTFESLSLAALYFGVTGNEIAMKCSGKEVAKLKGVTLVYA